LAGTRAQSVDRYGTLHSGQVLRGSLPLLSLAFRRSHFRRQIPPRPQQRERSVYRKMELWARMVSGNFAEMTPFLRYLGIFYMPQIYDMGPTSLLPLRRKECWWFFRPKIPKASAGFEPASLGTRGQHANHRSRSNLVKSTYFYILLRLTVFCMRNTEWRLNYRHDMLNSWDLSVLCELPSEWQPSPPVNCYRQYSIRISSYPYSHSNKSLMIIVRQNRSLWLVSLVRIFQWSSAYTLLGLSRDRHIASIF
jgi:hypothetical protein